MSRIDKKFINDNAVDGAKIRLENADPLRALKADGSTEVDILKINAQNNLDFMGNVITNAGDPVISQDIATKSYVDSNTLTDQKYSVTLSSTDITNQYIDLPNVAFTNSVEVVIPGGPLQVEGVDYSVSYTGGVSSHTRITFLGSLASGGASALIAGDTVDVLYTIVGGGSSSTKVISPGDLTIDTFSGNGSQTVFTLSVDPRSKNNTNVYVSGVYQEKSTYSLSTTTLTFSSAPPSGTNNIEVVTGTSLAVNQPATGSVSRSTFASNAFVAPTISKFTSGSGTYTVPAGVLYLRVRMVGGGGGGGGQNGSATGVTAGGNTTFGSSFLVANGGGGASGAGGAGGTASMGAGASGVALAGAVGSGYTVSIGSAYGGAGGGAGASSPFGGAGGGAPYGASGTNAVANTGSGGGGCAGPGSGSTGGGGGGAGGYIDAYIASPASSYAYSVGVGGTGCTSPGIGGNGGSGLIIIEEHYQ